MPWLLRRTDDNGVITVIERGLTRTVAYRCLAALEARGHKQLYEVKEEQPVLEPVIDAPVAQR